MAMKFELRFGIFAINFAWSEGAISGIGEGTTYTMKWEYLVSY